jgi:predicted membrane channel-forming protein YqfA (hemolysin III family)
MSLPSDDTLAWHDEASYSYLTLLMSATYLTLLMSATYAGFSNTFASISLETIHSLLNSLL